MRFPVSNPQLGQAELSQVLDALSSGQVTQGGRVKLFEERLAQLLNVPHVVACNSGTSALHLALLVCDVRPGDEVLVPDLTFIATANAVRYVGAVPVLVDVERETWNINVHHARTLLTPRTKAIVPVHLYGAPCNMVHVDSFARQYGLTVIEDAAEGLGGTYGSRALGTFGSCGTFSFYGNKIITTAEGGAVATHDKNLADKMRTLRGQGQGATRYLHEVLGYNYRMSDLHAALGLAQLSQFDTMLVERHTILARYKRNLKGLMTMQNVEGSAPWLLTGLLPKGVNRDRVATRLAQKGIETRPMFVPLHRQPMYERNAACFPVAESLSDRGLSLPTYVGLSLSEVDEICEWVEKAVMA